MTPPVFSHGALRLYLLKLLDESPRHGYELIHALSDRFGGTYSPSAGTIYPRLAKLEEDGLVSKAVDGRKTVYSITEAGRRELAARAGELDAIEDDVTDSVRRLADQVRAGVDSALRSLRADLATAARESRRGATETPPSPAGDGAAPTAREASRTHLRDAELVVNDFRQRVRADLRAASARGAVSGDAVSALRTRLDDAHRELVDALSLRPTTGDSAPPDAA